MGEEEVVLAIGSDVDDRWTVIKKLGAGAFGAVYEVVDRKKKIKGAKALKVEPVNTEDQVLKVEVAVLGAMKKSSHVCVLYACGRNTAFSYLVMSLLGPSLCNLRKKTNKAGTFSVPTSMYVARQCVTALRDMHTCGWLHRDVKPSNFATGHPQLETCRTVHILDFGLSRQFKSTSGKLRPARDGVGFRGTLRYSSINSHHGIDLGRGDDLISLIYMTVEMVKGTVPWKKLDDQTEVGIAKEAAARSKKLFEDLNSKWVELYDHLIKLTYPDIPQYQLFLVAIDSIQTPNKNLTLDWEKDRANVNNLDRDESSTFQGKANKSK